MAIQIILKGRVSGKETVLNPADVEKLRQTMGKNKFNARFSLTEKEVSDPVERTLTGGKKKETSDEAGKIL